MRTLDYQRAAALAEAVLATAKIDGGEPVTVAVVGLDRGILRLDRQDGAEARTANRAISEGGTAVEWGRDTYSFADDWRQRGQSVGTAESPAFSFWGGGVVLHVDGEVVGALGVAGRGEQKSHELALAVATKLGYRPGTAVRAVGRFAVAQTSHGDITIEIGGGS